MNNSLIIAFFILPIISFGQSRIKQDAAYKTIGNECAQKFHKPEYFKIVYDQLSTNYISDSGALVISNSLLREKVALPKGKHFDFTGSYSIDSIISILFSKGYLTNENIIQSANFHRKVVSQYSDTLDFSMKILPGNIHILSFDFIETPKYLRNKSSISFDICVTFAKEKSGIEYLVSGLQRIHFYLILDIINKEKNGNLYLKLKTSELKCLSYQGFEI